MITWVCMDVRNHTLENRCTDYIEIREWENGNVKPIVMEPSKCLTWWKLTVSILSIDFSRSFSEYSIWSEDMLLARETKSAHWSHVHVHCTCITQHELHTSHAVHNS